VRLVRPVRNQGRPCARREESTGRPKTAASSSLRFFDVPSEASARGEGVEQVDVAIGARGAACERPEDLQAHNTVALAYLAQALNIDIGREHARSLREQQSA
jgi:hypothetical protein